jgi:hypothetical protein
MRHRKVIVMPAVLLTAATDRATGGTAELFQGSEHGAGVSLPS